MTPKRPISSNRLLILAILLLSIPVHMAVKQMVWFEPKQVLPAGVQAPDFHMQDEKGRYFRLTGFLGRPVLLTFCTVDEPACHTQARDLNRFVEQYAHRGLEVLFVADSPTVDQMNQFDQIVDADFLILQDRGGKIRDKFGATILPTHIFIDKTGAIFFVQAGRIRESSGRMRRVIEALIEDEP